MVVLVPLILWKREAKLEIITAMYSANCGQKNLILTLVPLCNMVVILLPVPLLLVTNLFILVICLICLIFWILDEDAVLPLIINCDKCEKKITRARDAQLTITSANQPQLKYDYLKCHIDEDDNLFLTRVRQLMN